MNIALSKDISQKALISFSRETESILASVLKTLDKSSNCKIHTSLDLGFPHDVERIAGGFPTGSFIEWNCNTPFIPVDTTVNVCTGSIFELDCNELIHLDETSFDRLKAKLMQSSYLFNFQRGNHFIILARSISNGKYYLVLHSSASEFKKQYNGLYPVEGNWYYNDIKVFRSKGRYIRYIAGKKAELFSTLAKQVENYNAVRHSFIAETLLDGIVKINNDNHYHHYFMPDAQSVMIGSYLQDEGAIAPIFTAHGLPIFMYETYSNAQNELIFRGNKKYLIPHGWGKRANSNVSMEVGEKGDLFKLNGYQFPINSDSSLRNHPDLSIRSFSTDENHDDYYFKFASPLINGKVVDKLIQVLSFTKYGLNKWN